MIDAPPRGRPRHASIDRAIVGATIALLGEVGYGGLSLAALAQRAGVGRPALYRRFPGKAELVVAALLHMSPEEPPLPRGPREAIAVLLAATADTLGRPGGMAILGSLLAQEARDPKLIELFRERVFAPRRAVVRALLERARDSGELRADVDIDVLDAFLFGGLLARTTLGEPIDEPWRRRVLDEAWRAMSPARG